VKHLTLNWSSWILTECNLSWKFVKYCILSEVCMINSTVSPQMWCIKSMKCWFTRTQTVGKILLSKLDERKKFGLICFPRIRFPGLIYCDQEPLWLLNVIEDDCYFLGVHIRLSTRCKIWFTLGLFANYFPLKSLNLSLKSIWMCSRVYWFVEYKFIVYLNYKFINESFAFSPG